jgi:hypothetical protein
MAKKKAKKELLTCVESIPPACPNCGCTDRTAKASIVRRDINGVARNGKEFSVVQWNYCNCKECNQRYKFIERLRPTSRTDAEV